MFHPVQLRAVALRRPLAGLFTPQPCPSRILVRAKSLSAIHRGMRNSEKAQFGGSRRPTRDSNESRHRDTFDRRARRRSPAPPIHRDTPTRRDEFMDKFKTRAQDSGGTRNWRQEQKLRKKLRKKEEEKRAKEEAGDEETGRRTRRKRFADPENEFGQKSFVHRMKYGDLKDVAAELPIKQFVQPRSFRETRNERREFDFEDPNGWKDEDLPSFERQSGRSDNSSRSFQDSRSERRFDRSDRDSRPSYDAGRAERRFDRSDRDTHSRQDRGRTDRWNDQDGDSAEGSAPKRGRKKEMMPMTIKYTTAASQFLYGRSVVKAALEQGRRKLYNLYIYGGENRRDNKDNTFLSRLAEKQGVPITIVPTEEQRLMDKMSMGRPHNGFVLEASPLPQLPIRSLGKLEETPARLGFHVELDFQTKEEEAVNGTETFFRRANDVMPKPFVLLLNEIMDPGNLGGIIRTASYLGIDAVGITNRGSSTLTPVALKSAAGAVEEISLFTVDDPLRFIEDSGKAGWKTFAAVAPPDRKLVRKHGDKFISTDVIEANSPLNEHPCLLVLGNEGHGLSKPLKVAADYELSVPRFVQGSCIDSLNVSVAAGLLCHSFIKEPLVEAKPVQVVAPVVTPEPQVLVEVEEKAVEAEMQGVLPSSEGGEENKAEEVELEKSDKEVKEETTEEKKTEEEKPEEKKPEESKAENVEMMF
ncbi:SpoU-sub-bind domain-containing protein [Fusarium sp. LHS14.1]|nr:SpoU-sub-bind domain-containing protein [Fusarium sp. LHS14.1]